MLQNAKLDYPASDEYLSRTAEQFKDINLGLMDMFNKNQSKDFYLGMIAFERIVVTLLDRIEDREQLNDYLLSVGITVATIANGKNPINT